jgi:hypothetical protein
MDQLQRVLLLVYWVNQPLHGFWIETLQMGGPTDVLQPCIGI